MMGAVDGRDFGLKRDYSRVVAQGYRDNGGCVELYSRVRACLAT